MSPIEIEGSRALAELGDRFGTDRVGDPRIDARALAGHGFRLAKLPVAARLGEAARGTDMEWPISRLLRRGSAWR